MDVVLKDLVGDVCYYFIDDIVIFSKTSADHTARLENVLRLFEQTNLQLNPEKWAIAQPRVDYFVYTISQDGIAVSPDNVKAV
jgi:hypothetical protein